MNQMTLPFRHRIRNSGPGGRRASMKRISYGGSPQYVIFTSERGRNILLLWNQSGVRARDLRLSKQAALTNAPGSPPILSKCVLPAVNTGRRLDQCRFNVGPPSGTPADYKPALNQRLEFAVLFLWERGSRFELDVVTCAEISRLPAR